MSMDSFLNAAIEIYKQLYKPGQLFDWKTMHEEIEALKKCYNGLSKDEQLEKISLIKTLSFADDKDDLPFSQRYFSLKNKEEKNIAHWMNKIMAKYIRCLLQFEINTINRRYFFKSDIEGLGSDFEGNDWPKEIKTRIEYIKTELEILPENYCASDLQLDSVFEKFKNNFNSAIRIENFCKELLGIFVLLQPSLSKVFFWQAIHTGFYGLNERYGLLTEDDKKIPIYLQSKQQKIIQKNAKEWMLFKLSAYVKIILGYSSLELNNLLGLNTSNNNNELKNQVNIRIAKIADIMEYFENNDIESFFGKKKKEVLKDLDSLKLKLMRIITFRKASNSLVEVGEKFTDRAIDLGKQSFSKVEEKYSDFKERVIDLSKQGISGIGNTVFYYKDRMKSKLSFPNSNSLSREDLSLNNDFGFSLLDVDKDCQEKNPVVKTIIH